MLTAVVMVGVVLVVVTETVSVLMQRSECGLLQNSWVAEFTSLSKQWLHKKGFAWGELLLTLYAALPLFVELQVWLEDVEFCPQCAGFYTTILMHCGRDFQPLDCPVS